MGACCRQVRCMARHRLGPSSQTPDSSRSARLLLCLHSRQALIRRPGIGPETLQKASPGDCPSNAGVSIFKREVWMLYINVSSKLRQAEFCVEW